MTTYQYKGYEVSLWQTSVNSSWFGWATKEGLKSQSAIAQSEEAGRAELEKKIDEVNQ